MTDAKAQLPPDSSADENASSAALGMFARIFSRWPIAMIAFSVLATLLWAGLLGWILIRALVALF